MASVSRRHFLGGALALGLARPAFAATTTLSNARILVGDGTELKGGIRIEGGLITEIGPGVSGGEDQGGKILFPGFWDGGSTLGLVEVDQEAATHDDKEDSDAVMPQARVVDAYNSRSALIPIARRYGVLGGLIVPSAGQLVSGQAAWMRTSDTDALIQASAGVVINYGHDGTGTAGGPKSRMGVAARLRDLLDANKVPDPPKKKSKDKPPDPPTRAQAEFRALRTGERKAICFADRADDLLVAIDLAKEYKLAMVLVGGTEGHLVAKELADAGFPLIVGPIEAQPDNYEHPHAIYENAAILHKAGVRLGIRLGGSPHNLRNLGVSAAIAVANGLPWEAAIAAVCANSPSFFGLHVGKLAVGQEATFARADGDPLQARTHVEAVWMRGVPASMATRQTELFERFKTLR